MSYLQTYSLELMPDKSEERRLRLNGVTYDEVRAMAGGLSQLYGESVKLTIVREASTTEVILPITAEPQSETVSPVEGER
jgi:hypothetical protein